MLSPFSSRAAGILLVLVLAGIQTAAQTAVTTYHYDNSRAGQNITETILTPANVSSDQFGKLFSQAVDGFVYAQPLFVPALVIPGKGKHNVVFVATENDSVYAFDADSNAGANAKPLWHANLIDRAHGAAAGASPVNMDAELRCDAILPVVGTTSTPAIDVHTNTIYVETFSKESSIFVHRLHALDLSRGTEKFKGPVSILAVVAGRGAGTSRGKVAFDSLHQLNRPGLLLLGRMVYLAYASHCDRLPAHGWLFAYDALTLVQNDVFITTPNGFHGGIWMSGSAPAADSGGNVFLTTGNGSFDPAESAPTEWGNSLLKLAFLHGKVGVLDYFVPFNFVSLNRHDQDLGSGGVLLVPDQPGPHSHLLVTAGKGGTIYLMDRDQFAVREQHVCSECNSDSQILQELPRAVKSIFGPPVYWNHSVYFGGVGDSIKEFFLHEGVLSTTPSSSSREIYPYPGASMSISANGDTDGILWVVQASGYDTNGSAVLRAYDAKDVFRLLYASDRKPGDAPGGAVKFAVPMVANGKVYLGTAGRLSVYGLLK